VLDAPAGVDHERAERRRRSAAHQPVESRAAPAGPDLVAFQEVCYPGRRDQLAELVTGTGLYTTHQAGVLDGLPPNADRDGGTRWPHRVREIVEDRTAGTPDGYW
jgi:hypothetical protein